MAATRTARHNRRIVILAVATFLGMLAASLLVWSVPGSLVWPLPNEQLALLLACLAAILAFAVVSLGLREVP